MFDNEFTLSEIITVYNKARSAALAGKTFRGRDLEVGRLNRALGRLISKPENKTRYATTIDGCNCPDAVRTRFVCKHQAEILILTRLADNRREAEKTAETLPTPPEFRPQTHLTEYTVGDSQIGPNTYQTIIQYPNGYDVLVFDSRLSAEIMEFIYPEMVHQSHGHGKRFKTIRVR